MARQLELWRDFRYRQRWGMAAEEEPPGCVICGRGPISYCDRGIPYCQDCAPALGEEG